MSKTYNQFAGRSLERLSALSDGIFAFSMTLLVLDIQMPPLAAVHGEGGLASALAALFPRVLTWLVSLMTLGIFWVGQQTQLNHLKNSNRSYTWLNIGFLACVTAVPFSTRLLSGFFAFRLALLVYWANIFLLGTLILVSWTYACRSKLFRKEVTEEVYDAVVRRVLSAQALYAFGAALCFFGTSWSVGFIGLVQLNYVFAPRVPFLSRLTA